MAITKAALMDIVRNLKSENQENPEYDRALLEMLNVALKQSGMTPVEGSGLGISKEYMDRMYGVLPADSVPIVRTKPALRIYHVVMSEMTVTFTDWDAVKDFLGPRPIKDAMETLVCESEVTPEEYDKVCLMRREIT